MVDGQRPLVVEHHHAYDLTVRYDLIVNRSNINNSLMSLDYDNKNFAKHVVSLELASDWVWGR